MCFIIELNIDKYFLLRFIFVYHKSLKRTFKSNRLLNLRPRVVNSQKLFVVKKLV